MEDPDDELVKEVFAHFGLCLYLSQVIETGLINALTALETAASSEPTRQTFDTLYEEHEGLTFGNLLKKLSRHNFLPRDLAVDSSRMKSKRDHLAHRFFRDHDIDFVAPNGCRHMIDILQRQRDEFDDLNKRIMAIQADSFSRMGLNIENFEKETRRIIEKLRSDALKKWNEQ